MKTAFSSMAFYDRDIEFISAFACRHGYDAIELCMGDHMHLYSGMSRKELSRIAEVFKNSGIEIVSISGYAKFNSLDKNLLDRNLYEITKAIEFAEFLGASFVRSLGGPVPGNLWNPGKEKYIRSLSDYLGKAVCQTEGSNVEILQSTHNNFSPGNITAKVVDQVNSDRVNILWCVIHPLEYGELPNDTWKAIGKRVKLVHIKDAVRCRKKTSWDLRALGEGDLPLPEIFSILNRGNFNGPVSIEWEKHTAKSIQDSEYVLKKGIKYIKQYRD